MIWLLCFILIQQFIQSFFAAMKIVLISLALIATVNANVFDTNGMSKIGDIIQDIEDIKSASEDLDIMEARLAGLGAQMGLISSVKSSMTQAMDKTALTFTGEHPNEENGELCVNTHTMFHAISFSM